MHLVNRYEILVAQMTTDMLPLTQSTLRRFPIPDLPPGFGKSDTTGTSGGAGTASASEAFEFFPGSLWCYCCSIVSVQCSIFVDNCLCVSPFSICHYIVCPSIYGF